MGWAEDVGGLDDRDTNLLSVKSMKNGKTLKKRGTYQGSRRWRTAYPLGPEKIVFRKYEMWKEG